MTFGDAQDRVYEQLRANPSDKESNRLYPINLVKDSLSSIQQRTLAKRNYTFLNKIVTFDTSVDTAVAVATASGDITLEVSDASELNSSGKVVAGRNVITYTGISSDTLTGVSGITATHSVGTKVKQLYSLETDLGITNYDKSISCTLDGDEDGLDYYDPRKPLNSEGFTVYDGNLYLPETSKVQICDFEYKQSIDTLVEDDEEFVIPDEYVQLCIEYALYKCYKQVGNNSYVEAIKQHRAIVTEMEMEYGRQTEKKNRRYKSPYA